jgi:hypothetical protein
MEGVEAILREKCDNCTENNICRECYLAREGRQE